MTIEPIATHSKLAATAMSRSEEGNQAAASSVTLFRNRGWLQGQEGMEQVSTRQPRRLERQPP